MKLYGPLEMIIESVWWIECAKQWDVSNSVGIWLGRVRRKSPREALVDETENMSIKIYLLIMIMLFID